LSFLQEKIKTKERPTNKTGKKYLFMIT